MSVSLSGERERASEGDPELGRVRGEEEEEEEEEEDSDSRQCHASMAAERARPGGRHIWQTCMYSLKAATWEDALQGKERRGAAKKCLE